MRDAGLVTDDKRGYYVHYRLNEKTLAAWREKIEGLLDPAHGVCTDPEGGSPCAAMKEKAAGSRKT
jgi:DNA-binding transcriptional ArsR family regulator